MTLDFSFISGKVKLIVDRRTLLENEMPADVSFQHPFTLDGYALNILQQGDTFELRINNKVFSHLYNQVKTNTEFKSYEEEVKDIKVEEGAFENNNKPMKLNIGGIGGMKKKAKNVESENWGSFGVSSSGFPNYFGESTIAQVGGGEQKVEVKKSSNLLDDDEETTQEKSNIINESNNKESFIDFSVEKTQQK